MNPTFTQEEIITSIYKDSIGNFSNEIKNACITNWELKEEVSDFLLIKKSLDTLKYEPSQIAIEGILNYSVKSQEIWV